MVTPPVSTGRVILKMSFVLISDITIGPYSGVKVNDCRITKSMFSYVDKAIIKLPVTAVLKRADVNETYSAETAKEITEGMKVLVKLGYNGELKEEFEGFVARVNYASPCEIECEGYSYLLRKKRYLKSFKNTTLLKVLEYLVDGTGITLSSLIPSMSLRKWVMNSQSGTEVLEELKKVLKVDAFFTGKELYVGLQYLKPKAETKYRLGWNTIKDADLKLREAKNQEVIINVKGKKADGTKVTASFGEKGEIKQVNTHFVEDKKTLDAIAESMQKKISYTGYEGKLKAFLQPYCEPGYSANIEDKKYPDRSGVYIVTGTEVTYGMTGARRTVDIGFKLR